MESKTLHLMVGGPASGKTTIRDRKFAGLPIVDMDEIQSTHPDYNPKAITAAVHQWASTKANERFYSALGQGESFVYDSTGTNVEKMVTFINAAHGLGFTVKVTYVQCSLHTAMQRNAIRERSIPVEILNSKYSTIAVAVDIICRYADTIEVVTNE